MHTHSLFWHAIHYLPLILIITAFVASFFSAKLAAVAKKYISAFAVVGFSAHLIDSGVEFKHAFEPCYAYIAVMLGVTATSVKRAFVRA